MLTIGNEIRANETIHVKLIEDLDERCNGGFNCRTTAIKQPNRVTKFKEANLSLGNP